ncbi:MAG TPA: hypothetical protein VGD88_00385 [Opitutaceae bacterium]
MDPRRPTPAVQSGRSVTGLDAVLLVAALGALLLVFHNYAWPVLPRRTEVLTPDRISHDPAHAAHVFSVAFSGSEPNLPLVNRSAVRLLEDGRPYSNPLADPIELHVVGGKRYTHLPGVILFSTEYNSDPRTNGHLYSISYPVLHSRFIGQLGIATLIVAFVSLAIRTRRIPVGDVRTPPTERAWKAHIIAATLMLLAGLYCNTGTLSPYAITTFPHQDPATGYLYNPDHIHFRALFDFVDGAPRETWDKALMLRRILFPALAWPFMKIAGFELGGTIASLVFNAAGLLITAFALRRRIGEQGAILAAWLIALYPGAAYWGGLPYPYALIAPVSLLLLLGVERLTQARGLEFAAVSTAMGVGYLAYDLAVFFLPTSLLVLVWQRRLVASGLSLGLQIAPTAAWFALLSGVFEQSLTNSNSHAYGEILNAYRNLTPEILGARLAALPEIAAVVAFGSNFFFLPALFLAVLAVNQVSARVRPTSAEICLLLVGIGIFAFNHLAPDYGGWQMRGAWISRIYQPLFPVFIFFSARWWQHFTTKNRFLKLAGKGVLAAVLAGNALVVFGPILGNPGRVSESAFAQFYHHNENWVYLHCLEKYGRKPLGFTVTAR